MGRRGTRNPDFSARIETLEDRRVMSADPLGGLLSGGIEHHGVEEPPVLEQTIATPPPLDQHITSDPDFWINPEDAAGFDEYFQEVEQTLVEAHNQTGWFNVRSNYGFTGRGQTVAVIDSGIAYNHFALGGGLGANYRVVGGWDFTEENDANPYDDGASGGHGTHVSGIIGNNSSGQPGVAPGVDLVGLRVFNDSGAGYFSWVESALRWVHTNRNSFANPITTVNLSLGVSSWNAATIPNWANLEDEFAQLEADGVFIAVSAGNSFGSYNQPGLSYPAASPYVVPVMSTDDSGLLSNFSQRLGRAIAAPGRTIISTVPDYLGNNNGVADDFSTMSGTSMAAPYVAGASVIVREAMQYVGMTNITQDMIYNHMMATADAIYDAATNASYKRLDVQAAIDALMPADDFGSSLASAYNLSGLSGGQTINGAIGTLTDADYFRFTAAANGTVTFNVTSSQQAMDASWQAYNSSGQVIATQTSDAVSFSVVGGQSYSVRLTSTGGMGRYTFNASVINSAPPVFTDWGSISSKEMNNQTVAGDAWYRILATQNGLLTVEGQFNSASGAVGVELYNANFQVIANNSGAGSVGRADVAATAGTEYYIRVFGTSGDVDFKLVNLVSQAGSSVTVGGSTGDDAYTFTVGAAYNVSVNGVQYNFALGSANQFTFQGGAGSDSIVLQGGTGAETATLRAGTVSLVGAAYSASVTGAESQSVRGGGGADVAYLHDSAGDDVFTAWSDRVTLAGAGFSNEARGFQRTKALGTAGGNDQAAFYDTTGDDLFIAGYIRTILTGNGYYNEAEGFDGAVAHATAGGYDRADLYDSAGNDVFTAWSDRATLVGAGFNNEARGFERTKAFGMLGGNDQANFYDSAGDDLFIGGYIRAILSGNNFYNEAEGFDSNVAHATGGGNDRVELYDSPNNDVFTAWSDKVVLTGSGFYNEARGFEQSTAFGVVGGYDLATYYDSVGNDLFSAWSNRSLMTGAGYQNEARNFEKSKAWSTAGGYDQSALYDGTGDDVFIAGYIRGILFGAGYYNEAEGFDTNVAYATAGGYDRVEFYDSVGNDVYTAWSDRATITGAGFNNEARGFERTKAFGSIGNDEATFYDSIGDDQFIAGHLRAMLFGKNFFNEAEGFKRSIANATTGGYDRAELYDSPNNDSLTGLHQLAVLSGSGFRHEMNRFKSVVAHMTPGNNDLVDVRATDFLFSIIGG